MPRKNPLTDEQIDYLAEHAESLTQFVKLAKSKYGIFVHYEVLSQLIAAGRIDRQEMKNKQRHNLDKEMFTRHRAFTKNIRNRCIEIRGNQCERCGITDWNDAPLKIQVHHRDGNRWNNTLDNLMVLCPNCHALTDNYGAANVTQSDLVDQEEVLRIYESTGNVEQTILDMQLPLSGNTIGLVREIISRHKSEIDG